MRYRKWHARHHRHHHGCQPGCGPGHHHHKPSALHRRLFVWFGVTILMTLFAVGWLIGRRHNLDPTRAANTTIEFAASRVAADWDDPTRLGELVRQLAEGLDGQVLVVDAAGATHARSAGVCSSPSRTATVVRDGAALGEVRLCATMGPTRKHVFIGLGIAGLMLWLATGAIARRLIRPLGQVASVARDIGDGNLSSRVKLRRHNPGEISALADAVNDMAERIEKQLSDQRALLAAVSHEIRTPLGHMKVLTELARDGDLTRLAELEHEIDDVDTLVDKLLASSRVEFESFDQRPLDARAVCVRAMERADVDAALLEIDTDAAPIEGDVALLSRAIENLLENAARHAEAITAVRIEADSQHVRIAVMDRGPGFDAEALERGFEQFYQGERTAGSGRGSLGLGLALVRRIAESHGGTATASNHEHGGCVTIELPRAARTA